MNPEEMRRRVLEIVVSQLDTTPDKVAVFNIEVQGLLSIELSEAEHQMEILESEGLLKLTRFHGSGPSLAARPTPAGRKAVSG